MKVKAYKMKKETGHVKRKEREGYTRQEDERKYRTGQVKEVSRVNAEVRVN